MSDYWDAVSRVAHGAPGSAEPRQRSILQRSIFEGGATFDQIDELDVTTSDATPVAEPAPATGVAKQAELLSTITKSKVERTENASNPLVAAKQPSEPAEIHLAEPVRDVEQHPTAGTPEQVKSRAPPEAAARFEVQRIESERTLRLVESRPSATVEFGEAAPASSAPAVPAVMLAPVPAQPVKLHEPAPVAAAPSLVVAAEPVEAPPAERPLPAPEPPLVIEIGRIDIRIESATPPPPAQPRRSEAKLVHSLDDFLTRRGARP